MRFAQGRDLVSRHSPPPINTRRPVLFSAAFTPHRGAGL